MRDTKELVRENNEKRENLETTIENLRKKYGYESVKTADVINNEIVVTDTHVTKK